MSRLSLNEFPNNMKEITTEKIDYGSKWREIDYQVFNSEKFINSIKKNNI